MQGQGQGTGPNLSRLVKTTNNKQQFAKTIDLKVEMATALRAGRLQMEDGLAVGRWEGSLSPSYSQTSLGPFT